MLKKQVSPKIVAIVFAVIVVCFAIAVYVSAWTEPTAVPPGANVDPPLNVSNTGQIKAGSLRLGGLTVDNDTYLATEAGNVGIGTVTPGYKLDVNGDINIPSTGFLRIGGSTGSSSQVLTQTATGIAWQTPAAATGFGDWVNVKAAAKCNGPVQGPVTTDGFLLITSGQNNHIAGFTGPDVASLVERIGHNVSVSGSGLGGFTMPIRKGEYWKITCYYSVDVKTAFWLPLGL